jgi:hypothetical protein
MPLSAAEKQRRYRQRLKDKDKDAAMEKERRRWHQRQAAGKITPISDLTERQKRAKRRYWKKHNNLRVQRKQVAVAQAEVSLNQNEIESVLTDCTPSMSCISVDSSSSRQRIRGRKVKRKDKSAAYRKINDLETKVVRLKRECERLRKQAERAKANVSGKRKRDLSIDENNNACDDDTPRKKARKMSDDPKVRRVLKFHYAMMSQLKQRYSEVSKNRANKQTLCKVFGTGAVLKKYRTIHAAKRAFGLSVAGLKRCETQNVAILKPEPVMQPKRAVSKELLEQVKSFYVREDISRSTAGKKETVTRKKMKKQKHFLLEPIARTYKTFRTENPKTGISLATFRRLRPFWVMRPGIKDRDTCRCSTCDNFTFMHDRLKELNILHEQSPRMLFVNICCNTTSKDCMYRECKQCCNRNAIDKHSGTKTTNKQTVSDVTWWWQWRSVNEMLGEKTIKKTKKIRVQGTVNELVSQYNVAMQRYSKHCYSISHQFKICKMKRENLGRNEIWLHIDFAENWCTKSLREVQAAHFGGSHNQLSLHTCVAYSGLFSQPRTICTISDNTDHGPIAIWNHLTPVLSDFKMEFPDLDTLHVMSDGPVTQYRGRGNLHLLSNVPYDLGFKFVFWNFSEASHGKGAADGVGAAVKRLCDNLALSGLDLTNASSVCSAITGLSKTKIYEIPSDFNGSGLCLPDKQIPPVTGIMKVHQIISYKRGTVYTRDVSCYCSDRKVCQCFHPVQRCVLSARGAMNELLESEVLKNVLPQVTKQWALVSEQQSALIPKQSEHSTLVAEQPSALVPEHSELSALVVVRVRVRMWFRMWFRMLNSETFQGNQIIFSRS